MAVVSTSCPELFKVVIIGDNYSGKSCLMGRFVNGHFREYISTIGETTLKMSINYDIVLDTCKYSYIQKMHEMAS